MTTTEEGRKYFTGHNRGAWSRSSKTSNAADHPFLLTDNTNDRSQRYLPHSGNSMEDMFFIRRQRSTDEKHSYRDEGGTTPIKLRGTPSSVSGDTERHRKQSSEEDNFFEELNVYVRNKEKESGITNRPTTKVHQSNIPSPQPEKVLPPVKSVPVTKTPTPTRKLAGTLNSPVIYEEANRTECRPANSPRHQVCDSPIKSTVESPPTPPSFGPKYKVSPQVSSPRPRIEPKFYQEPPVAANCTPRPVNSSFTTKQIDKKPTPFPSVEEKTRLYNQSPKQLSPRMDTKSAGPSPFFSDKKVIIIDIGHYYVRAGVLRDGDAIPDLCLPNIFGVTSTGLLFGDAVPQITDAELAKSLGSTSLISPLRRSQITSPIIVKDVPIQKDFFLKILRRLNLHDYDKGYKLLLCLPTRASALRPYFIDYFLGPTAKAEGFGIVEAVATISAFRAALQTPRVPTCLVISLSADLEIIPLAEGGLVEHGRSTIALYGEEALRSLMKEMVKENIDLSEEEIECFGHYIYREVAFIENKETKCHDVVIDLSQYAPYPINKRISVPAELRRRASDALLRPEQACTYNGELPPFRTLLNGAIQSCDVDLRSAICSNVLIIGEFADIEGLRERVSEEMQALLPEGASPPTVQVAKNAAGLAYEGACLLSTVLQGPQPPRCPWFRFVDAKAWSLMRSETGCSTSLSGTRLLSRLNKDCLWP